MELTPNRAPVNGTFELTVRCNLHCRMCLFRHDDSENNAIIAQEKTTDEWIDMAQQVAKAGTVGLLITGGEPLFRKDFAQIWEGIYRVGFQIQLYTNATLVTPEILALFRKYPPHRIGISIYGASENTYQKVCGNGDAYHLAMEGISRLSTLPSILDFRTTIIKDNLDDINEMEEWVRQNFGEDHILTHTKMVLKPVRGGCSEASKCRLDPDDNIRLYLQRHYQYVKRALGQEDFDCPNIRFVFKKDLPEPDSPKRLSLFGCDAGMNAYTITWDGRLLGCQVLGSYATEPYKDGFQEAWDTYPTCVTHIAIDPKCLRCDDAWICFSCYATRFAESGYPGGSSEYVCCNTEMLIKHSKTKKEDNNVEVLHESLCSL